MLGFLCVLEVRTAAEWPFQRVVPISGLLVKPLCAGLCTHARTRTYTYRHAHMYTHACTHMHTCASTHTPFYLKSCREKFVCDTYKMTQILNISLNMILGTFPLHVGHVDVWKVFRRLEAPGGSELPLHFVFSHVLIFIIVLPCVFSPVLLACLGRNSSCRTLHFLCLSLHWTEFR